VNDFGFGQAPVVDPLGEIDPLTGLRKPVGMLPQQRQQVEAQETSAETRKALAQSLRNTKNWMGSQFSLDTPKDPSATAMGADAAISMIPGLGSVTSARDVERARRDNDPVAGGLAATGLIPGGALAALGAKGALFAGVRALRAPKNLHEAELAEHIGEDAYKKTGWFRGVENHEPWKWEIDDSLAELKNLPRPNLQGEQEYAGKLKDLLHHPELYKNYPDVGEIYVTAKRNPLKKAGEGEGSYMHSGNGMDAEAFDQEELRNTLLHEIQHAIQAREHFDPGANTDAIAKALRDARVKSGTPPSTSDEAKTWQLYLGNMGETESRVVENRSRWTPEQRKRINPLSQMGNPDDLFDFARTVSEVVKHTK